MAFRGERRTEPIPADYARSIEVLRQAKDYAPDIMTKSGLMLGFGEQKEEVLAVMRDLREAGCDIFTLGQYLSPSYSNCPVLNFPTPDDYAEYVPEGLSMGFKAVASAPLWRSSFKADELYRQALQGMAG